MTEREDYEQRTVKSFKKTYGENIYLFSYEKKEVEGYTSVLVMVRRKRKGESKLRVGELVHYFFWPYLDDEEDAA